jgi:NAD(P)-dependent dehydrogenase (short-subunit alcohol dehydrogenase family)
MSGNLRSLTAADKTPTQALATRTHPRRLMALAELADVAVFAASDKASGLTGTSVNLTLGSLDD